MLTNIPIDLVLEIIGYFKIDYRLYLFSRDDYTFEEANRNNNVITIEEFNHLKKLKVEIGTNIYFPATSLYLTSKIFGWLKHYEFIRKEIYSNASNIYTYNIAIMKNGLQLNGCFDNIICGYSYYDNGVLIYGNEVINEDGYIYRKISSDPNTNYYECSRWGNNCHDENCLNCQQLNAISDIIFEKDPFLKSVLIKSNSWEFIIRPIKNTKFGDIKFIYIPDL